MREAAAIGALRASVWGYESRALLCEDRARAYERIALQPLGAALAESLAEARQRATYYRQLALASAALDT